MQYGFGCRISTTMRYVRICMSEKWVAWTVTAHRSLRHGPLATAVVVSLSVVFPVSGRAQATLISAPENNYLLSISQRWGAESVLGDLRQRPADAHFLEVRAWGGYGVTGTGGVVLRREAGKWRAWSIRVQPCDAVIPISVGDTASSTTEAYYVAKARKDCDAARYDTRNGVQMMLRADTLIVTELPVTAKCEAAWRQAVTDGLLVLPPRVPRQWIMMDGFTYVIEVRHGEEYRASVIEYAKPPETAADRQVQAVYAALMGILPAAAR